MNNPPFSELLAQFRAAPHSLLNAAANGIFLIDKPSGVTSHDVVARLKKQHHWAKVGHGGTLDPLATGLLIILTGQATRLFDALHESNKEYLADFRLGIRTDSQDITGKVIAKCTAEIKIERALIEQTLANFRGEIWQIPPMFSALKHHGKKLVDWARRGQTVEREPRRVLVNELELLDYDGATGKIRVVASKGFYVRTLIDDFGEKIGCGATLTALRRTRVAMFSLADAVPLVP